MTYSLVCRSLNNKYSLRDHAGSVGSVLIDEDLSVLLSPGMDGISLGLDRSEVGPVPRGWFPISQSFIHAGKQRQHVRWAQTGLNTPQFAPARYILEAMRSTRPTKAKE